MTKARTRGSKRKCQNEACGSRFYDLQRTTFQCPVCASPFDVARAEAEERPAPPRAASRWPRQPRFTPSPAEVSDPVETASTDEDEVIEVFADDGAEVVLEDDDADTSVATVFDGGAREPDAA